MNTATLTRQFAALPFSTYDEALAMRWRKALRQVLDHELFIRQHRKTITERDDRLSTGTLVHRPEYVAYAEKRLAERLVECAAAVRVVSEAEIEMDEIEMDGIGMLYARSSDDWRGS